MQHYAYGQQYGGVLGGGVGALGKPGIGVKAFRLTRFKRMNVVAVCLAVFLPWLAFVFTMALLSFSFHYRSPLLCKAILVVAGLLLGGLWCREVARRFRRRSNPEAALAQEDARQGDWSLFIYSTSLITFVAAIVLGSKNFANNTQPYYDIANLSTYTEVNPATVKGEELMDAGLTTFVTGSKLELRYAMSFRNSETYCVAPITSSDAPLSTYDYWAVGINCCSEGASWTAAAITDRAVSSTSSAGFATMTEASDAGSSWKCPNFDKRTARAGVRAMHNEDRAFFRLAVQQAQSAFGIRATHPLFFYWTNDPAEEAYGYLVAGYRQFLIGMYSVFAIQLTLVTMICIYFIEAPGIAI